MLLQTEPACESIALQVRRDDNTLNLLLIASASLQQHSFSREKFCLKYSTSPIPGSWLWPRRRSRDRDRHQIVSTHPQSYRIPKTDSPKACIFLDRFPPEVRSLIYDLVLCVGQKVINNDPFTKSKLDYLSTDSLQSIRTDIQSLALTCRLIHREVSDKWPRFLKDCSLHFALDMSDDRENEDQMADIKRVLDITTRFISSFPSTSTIKIHISIHLFVDPTLGLENDDRNYMVCADRLVAAFTFNVEDPWLALPARVVTILPCQGGVFTASTVSKLQQLGHKIRKEQIAYGIEDEPEDERPYDPPGSSVGVGVPWRWSRVLTMMLHIGNGDKTEVDDISAEAELNDE